MGASIIFLITNISNEYVCLRFVFWRFVTCVATCNKWLGLNTPKHCYYKMNEIWEVAVVAIYFCIKFTPKCLTKFNTHYFHFEWSLLWMSCSFSNYVPFYFILICSRRKWAFLYYVNFNHFLTTLCPPGYDLKATVHHEGVYTCWYAIHVQNNPSLWYSRQLHVNKLYVVYTANMWHQ